MITIRILYFLIALGIFVAALLTTGAYYYLRSRRRKKYPYGKWEDILKRLTIVDRDSIEMIARDFVDETGQQRTDESDTDLDPSEIWDLIGGMKGLRELEQNCAVLVDLVFYVQQWYPEALVITEQMRQYAREVEWHISQLKAAEKTGKLNDWFADYAQRAVAKYYIMTRQVLTLYEQGNFPGVMELQRAL
jgi:hypothetical protein